MIRELLLGAAAGAAGTSALHATTYADMAWRGRPASRTPEQSVQRLAEALHVEVPGSPEERENRLSGLGALIGIATGVGVGVGYGVARGFGLRLPAWAGAGLTTAVALVVANGPMTLLGITDPRSWSRVDWLSDLVPHVAYGLVIATTYAAGDR